MLVSFRRLVLLALLLIVPFQGVAAVVHALGCMPHAEHPMDAATHDGLGHDHGAIQHHPDEPAGGAGDHTSHQCCHHYSAAPLALSTTATAERNVVPYSVALLELSFVLEQPQRPPRS